MAWLNARPSGSEVQRTDEVYTVGQYETGYVFPRGLALEETPTSSVVVKKSSDNSVMTEVTGTPSANQYRVLYDPNQPLGGAFQFNAAQAGIGVKLTYKDRGSLVWAHDLATLETIVIAKLALLGSLGSAGQVLRVNSGATAIEFGAPGFIGVRAAPSVTGSISTATYTSIPLATESDDSSGFHDNSTNNSRITIPSGLGGKYLVIGSIEFNGNATGVRGARILAGGTTMMARAVQAANSVISIVQTVSILNLSAGGYIELQGYQDTGSSLGYGTSDTFLQVAYLGV